MACLDVDHPEGRVVSRTGPPRAEVLLWHDRIHELQDAERLYFWRLSFTPSYDREAIVSRLRSFFREVGVYSHTIYETLGEYDLLVRMWVPRVVEHDELELKLWQALRELKLWNINYLSCRTERHWADDGPAPDVPPDSWPPVTDPVIDEVSDFNQHQSAGEPWPRSLRIGLLLASGVLRCVPTDRRGVRFFITFDHPRLPFNPNNRRIALSAILTACDMILSDWNARPLEVEGAQISVYEGVGTMTDFLVLARAPHTYFHTFVRDLLEKLRGAGLDALFDMRPYTHMIADQMFTDFSEDRSRGREGEHQPIDIQSDEAEMLEFKATLALNVRELLVRGEVRKDPRVTHGVTRAICGLLNSPKGGTLVLGVLETRRELERVKDSASYVAALVERFAYEMPGDATLPADFPNALIGVEAEIGEGLPFRDEDAYITQLTELVRRGVSPNPWPFLSVELRGLSGLHLCVVSVRPGDRWFYARSVDDKHEEFYVREGGATRAYAGTESDLYKSANPRAPGTAG